MYIYCETCVWLNPPGTESTIPREVFRVFHLDVQESFRKLTGLSSNLGIQGKKGTFVLEFKKIFLNVSIEKSNKLTRDKLVCL